MKDMYTWYRLTDVRGEVGGVNRMKEDEQISQRMYMHTPYIGTDNKVVKVIGREGQDLGGWRTKEGQKGYICNNVRSKKKNHITVLLYYCFISWVYFGKG